MGGVGVGGVKLVSCTVFHSKKENVTNWGRSINNCKIFGPFFGPDLYVKDEN